MADPAPLSFKTRGGGGGLGGVAYKDRARPPPRGQDLETLFQLKIEKNQKIYDFRPKNRGVIFRHF